MLQETHITTDNMEQIDKEWLGLSCHSFGTANARGVSILFRHGLNVTIRKVEKDTNGLTVCVDIDDICYNLTCIYAPTHDKPRDQCTFFRDLRNSLLRNHISTPTMIIGGDFNIPLDADKDRTGVSNVNKKVIKTIANLCKSLKTIDAWRTKHPTSKQYTYRNINMSSRIDYWLVPEHIREQIDCDIRPAVKTDHNAVSLKIQLPNSKRGPGLWKLNVSFLKDQEYNNLILDVLNRTKNEASTCRMNKRTLWDMCKLNIKQASIKYGHALGTHKSKGQT